jgi:hypothetical protein
VVRRTEVRGLSGFKDGNNVSSLPYSREVRITKGEVKEFGHVGNATGAEVLEVKSG